jgi:hypothetical protein
LNKRLELVSLFYLLWILFFSLESAYGLAGSLESLQNQVNNETGYQTELKGYMSSHNMTFGITGGKQLTIDDFDVSEMEHIVKSHMEYCQTTNASERAKNQVSEHEWGIIENRKVVLGDC